MIVSFLLHLASLLAFLLAIVAGAAPCCAHFAQPHSVRVVMDDNYPPYVFHGAKGEIQGILVDQWRLWEEKTGIRVELHAMNWAEAQQRMMEGEFDVIDTIFRNENREKIYEFTPPYAIIPVPLFFHADITGIRGVTDLQGFTVAAKAGGNVLSILRKNGITNIVEYPSYEKIIEAARAGKVKVFTVDRPPALYYLNKLGIQDRFRETAPMYSGELHRAVAKGNLELLQVVKDGFATITPAEYQAIERKWNGHAILETTPLKYLLLLGGVATVIIVVLAFWNRALRRAVTGRTAELADRQKLLSTILDSSPAAIAITRIGDGTFLSVNATFEKLFGYSNSELIGNTSLSLDIYSPDDRERLVAPVREQGAARNIELALRCKDGTLMQTYTSAVPFIYEGQECMLNNVVDVTEKKAIERELALREEELRVIFDTSQAGILLVDPQGVITLANERMAVMFGYPLAELIGSHYPDHVHRAERDTGDSRMQMLISGEIDNVNTERRFIRKDGSDFWGYLSGRRHVDRDGTFISLVGVIADITERKQAETLLRESEDKFRSIFDHAIDGILIADIEQRRIIEANRTACLMLGYAHDELLGLNIEQMHPPEHLQETLALFERIVRKEVTSAEDLLVQRKDGSVFYADINAAHLVMGGQSCVVGTFRDTTERRKTREALLESENRYRSLIQQAAAWIWSTDDQIRHTYSNRYVEGLLGYQVEEFLAMNLFDLIHPDDHDTVRKVIARAKRNGSGWHGMLLRWRHRDGSWRYMESSGGPVFDASGRFSGLNGVDIDVTARINLQEERDKSQRLESLGVLAGGIAHDFNNILTGILGNVSFARMLIGEDHAAFLRLADCEKAAQRASELTRQLLTFSRGGEPVRKAVDTKQLITECLSFVLRGANVKGEVDFLPDTWWSDVDAGQMSQVINNLLINAKQAMPEGGTVTVKTENVVVHESDPLPIQAGRYIRVTIIDRGAGIPAELLPRIFDPYFTTKSQGSGLGLASVYSILKRHGGMVTVSSKIGEGSAFTLLIPAVKAQTKEIADKEPVIPSPTGHGNILVMDDEEMIRHLAVSMLKTLGYKAESCADGREAVARHAAALERGAPFDAILLDLTVPGGMGGKEAAQLIHARDPKVAMVVSSGYSSDTVIADYQDHGFSGAVIKPYTMQRMAAELARVLRKQGD
ncbi:MAG: PAS domain S-box protein [Geobacter sp.]|nr:PAS domain S-box protein [Geobacter sp.]